MSDDCVDVVMSRLSRHRELLQAADEQLRQTSAKVSSADASVSVEVDGYGAMTGLTLNDSAYHHGAEALAKLIVDLSQAAAVIVANRQEYLAARLSERLDTER